MDNDNPAPSPPARLAVDREEVSIVSPLRYPGSKRRLAGYIEATLRINNLRPALFVEPFAGGASVALQLLTDDGFKQSTYQLVEWAQRESRLPDLAKGALQCKPRNPVLQRICKNLGMHG
ncbi:MAG TPA: effector-associated domain EAD1-containing protein [Chloroflexia bacterium]|jgi:hypothetical protein